MNRQTMDAWTQARKVKELIDQHAPTADDAAIADKNYLDMKRAEQDGDKFLLTMAGVLYDGLAYGNWPWSPKTVDGILAAKR